MRHNLSDRLVVIGTSHVARTSVREIKKTYEEFVPDVIAIELDRQRLAQLYTKKEKKSGRRRVPPLSMARQIGLTGYLFLLFGGWVQQKIGAIVKTEPGAEMKAAYELAQAHQKKVVLADQPIQLTLRNLSRRWKGREKLLLFWDMLSAPFMPSKRKMVAFDPRKVPGDELLVELLGFFKGRYPSLFKVLVADRDRHLARTVKEYHKRFPDDKLLLVIGAGHTKGVLKILQS